MYLACILLCTPWCFAIVSRSMPHIFSGARNQIYLFSLAQTLSSNPSSIFSSTQFSSCPFIRTLASSSFMSAHLGPSHTRSTVYPWRCSDVQQHDDCGKSAQTLNNHTIDKFSFILTFCSCPQRTCWHFDIWAALLAVSVQIK
jgi:hypothetical protein